MVAFASYVASTSATASAFQKLLYTMTNAVVSSSGAEDAWVVVALVSLRVDILIGEDCSCYCIDLSAIQWVKCIHKELAKKCVLEGLQKL